MKKIIAVFTALALLSSPLFGQSFLNKLKEKAEQAVGGAIGGLEGLIPEGIQESAETVPQEDPNGLNVASGEQTFPSRRASSFGWDGVVTPSSAKFPIPLMNEFPAVPSAAELANPTEEAQIAYYKAIKAVTLRAEELNQENSCDDETSKAVRNKANQLLKDTFGLTDAEIAILNDDNASDADKQRISDKIEKALAGDLESKLDKYGNMSEEDLANEMQNSSLTAVNAVYDRNAAGIKKYYGVSAEEFKRASKAQMESQSDKQCPEMTALRKKTDAYQKAQAAANPSFKKEAAAFEKKMQQETMQATLSSSRNTGMGDMMGSVLQMQQKMAAITEYNRKAASYATKLSNLVNIPDENVDAKFSASDRKKVLDIKNRIYTTDNASVYNPLYLEALQIISTYRERAAKVWAEDVQKRFDLMKKNLPELIKLNREAVQNEILPECGLWRSPYNLVVNAGDLLAEAYSEFPSNYPKMYKEEVVFEYTVGEGRYPWWPEFSVFGTRSFDSVANGSQVFCSDDEGAVYQLINGSWSKISDEEYKRLNKVKKEEGPSSQTWVSQDGKRKVYYQADGSYIQLPEGDRAYPHVIKKDGNEIKWIHYATQESGNGTYNCQIVLCTYKL